MEDEVAGLIDLKASEVHPRFIILVEQSKVGKYQCGITEDSWVCKECGPLPEKSQ